MKALIEKTLERLAIDAMDHGRKESIHEIVETSAAWLLEQIPEEIAVTLSKSQKEFEDIKTKIIDSI